MSNDTAASRMRQNLLREYGIKVFNIGRPILCIRIPRSGIEELGPTESDAILDHMEPISKQLRPDEIRDVFIIADTNYVVIEPNTFFVQLETKGQSLVNKTVSTTATSIHVNREKQTIGPIERTPKNVISVRDEKHETDRDEKAAPLNTTPITSSTTEESVITTDEMNITEETTSQLKSQGSTGSRDSTSSTGSDKDEKTVSKILSDFARNGQKKKIVTGRLRSGRRAEVLTLSKRGRYVRYRMPGEKISDIAIAPTVRAAAHHAENGKIVIKKGDLREKIRRRRVSTLINIVFDTSGSMDEKKKIQITTTVVLALLKDAYQRRDRVSLVTYSGRSADLVLPFTSSVEAAKRYLEKVPFGGTTPMASGILMGLNTLLQELKRETSAVPIMILVTDGSANVSLDVGGNIKHELIRVCRQVAHHNINVLIVDISERGSELARSIGEDCGGRYYHPVLLNKETLYSAIKEERDDAAVTAAFTSTK